MEFASKASVLETKMHQNKQIYHEACGLFDGDPHVFRYYDQNDEVSVDLLTVEGIPLPDTVSYSTLGLIHHPVGQRLSGRPLRFELAGSCHKKYEYFPNLLSACSFDVMNSRFACHHGAVYTDLVNTYIQGSPLKHVLFVGEPDFWDGTFPALEFDDKYVRWLGLAPISNSELRFLEQNGADALLSLLRKHGVPPWDWERPTLL